MFAFPLPFAFPFFLYKLVEKRFSLASRIELGAAEFGVCVGAVGAVGAVGVGAVVGIRGMTTVAGGVLEISNKPK